MKVSSSEGGHRVRARVWVQIVIGLLAIAGALAVRNSEMASHRVGAVLLLTSGVLLVTVVVVDSIRNRRANGAAASGPRGQDHFVAPEPPGPKVRRIRSAAAGPRDRLSSH